MTTPTQIRSFNAVDKENLITLWEDCDLTRPWNDPQKDISRAIQAPSSDIWVMESNQRIIGSVMLGYDGHRGNIYYLAIHPDFQKQGLGKFMMEKVEAHFLQLGCPKINLMVRSTNLAVSQFYQNIGYAVEETHVHGKRLIDDQ